MSDQQEDLVHTAHCLKSLTFRCMEPRCVSHGCCPCRYITALRSATFDIRADAMSQAAEFLERDIMQFLDKIAPDPELDRHNPRTKVEQLCAAPYTDLNNPSGP